MEVSEGRRMKTMTCKQLGGPCDLAFHGNSADEVIKAEEVVDFTPEDKRTLV